MYAHMLILSKFDKSPIWLSHGTFNYYGEIRYIYYILKKEAKLIISDVAEESADS